MARQMGDINITGTIDDLCFYQMDDVYYVRMKSSLSSQQFWKGKAFERSRKSCRRFAEGNKLASGVYQRIEKEKRAYPVFCFLKKRAILLLKQGKTSEEVEKVLTDYLVAFGLIKPIEKNASAMEADATGAYIVLQEEDLVFCFVEEIVSEAPS